MFELLLFNHMKKLSIITIALALICSCSQESSGDESLKKYDFAYAGEWDTRNPDRQSLYIVKGGEVTLRYDIPLHDEKGRIQEFDDVKVTPEGYIFYAAMSQIGILDEEGNSVWKYICPEGTETHSCQPLDGSRIYFSANGNPAKIIIYNWKKDEVEKEIVIPTTVTNTHAQLRHVRMTRRGNFLVGLMGERKVLEISPDGSIVNEIDDVKAWHVEELENGNYLIAGDNTGKVIEMTREGEVVWELTREDLPFPVFNIQTAQKRPNGNIIFNSWVAGQDESEWKGTVQFCEVTPEKEVVWTLSSWDEPDFGPSTAIDIISSEPQRATGAPKMTHDAANSPLGKGKGIHPGRVAWIHAPGVAKWDGVEGMWHDPSWNDQSKADEMIREGIRTIAVNNDVKKAWKAIFKDFNKTHGRGSAGYSAGEKIAIKLNMNNTFSYEDNEELNSSPYVTLALLRSLVNDAGVNPADITVCEPSRYITDRLYDLCAGEFPEVSFVDNVGENGRIKCEFYDNAIPFTPGKGEKQKGLAKCIVDADYVINSALLKIHKGPGVTLTGKNWYGATSLDKEWRKNSHNGINQDKRNGKPQYSSIVDFVGHKSLGGNCLLFLIDGTYGSRDVNGAPNPKWESAPFNGNWACSVIMSQDALAGDSVALDLLCSEWPEVSSLAYCDLYLVEAASIPDTPSGTVYDPEDDGEPLSAPLGITEHWNAKHEYKAIDLVFKQIAE